MRKIAYSLIAVSFLVLLASSVAYAALDAGVTVGTKNISKSSNQTLTVTVNEAGEGILFVIQPTQTMNPWMNYLNSHPTLNSIWLSLSWSIKNQINNAIGSKIVSYKIFSVSNKNGGTFTFTFPTDFTGINGAPSTSTLGKYEVLLVYMSWGQFEIGRPRDCCCCCCRIIQIDFDCGSWFVVPEVPLGTAMALAATVLALPAYMLCKRRRIA